MIAFIVNMDNRNPIIPIASGPTTCTHRSPVLSECLQTHKVMTAAKTQGGAQSNKVVPGSKPMVEAIVGKYMKKDTDKTAKYDARAIPQTFQSDAAAMNPFHVVVEALSVARGLLPESASSTILRLASSCSSRVSQEIDSASGKSGRTNKARIATNTLHKEQPTPCRVSKKPVHQTQDARSDECTKSFSNEYATHEECCPL